MEHVTEPEPFHDAVLEARRVAVRAKPLDLLDPTSLTVVSGQRLLVVGDPGHGHTALALALAGRLRPSRGEVTLDGSDAGRPRRRRVVLVDVPGVSEPDGVLPLATVVGEELSMNGLPAGRQAVRAFLYEQGLREQAETTMEALPAALRTRVLADLAAMRPQASVLVLVLPDRSGAEPATWWSLAKDLIHRGLAVVVTCTTTSARLLHAIGLLGPDDAVPLGSTDLSFLTQQDPTVRTEP